MLEPRGRHLNDLTGSTVTCSQPCGVFVGHEATTIVVSGGSVAPIISEEQLFSSSTWGMHCALVGVKALAGLAGPVRIALKPFCLTFTPPRVTAEPPPTGVLRGAYRRRAAARADQPVTRRTFLQSEGGIVLDSGDPSFAFPAPTEQFRRNYVMLVPSQYHSNFINVVTSVDGTVTLDGKDVTDQFWAFGALKAGRLSVTAGQHRLECSERCGTEVYGWSNAVSYLFAGGLDLQTLVQ
jgi:hypothetical protein